MVNDQVILENSEDEVQRS